MYKNVNILTTKI